MRPYTSADTNFMHVLGDVIARRWWANTQNSHEAQWDLGSHTYTIGSGGMGFGNGGTAQTLVERTSGTVTTVDGGAFSIANAVDFDAGTGYYDIDGGLTIGSGTNDMETASWALTGTGAVSVVDTLDSLYINSTGTVSTSRSLATRAFNAGAGTFDISDDSLSVQEDIAMAAGFVWTWSAASQIQALKDGVVIAINGDSIPHLALSGSANLTSTESTGGTIASIDQQSAATDTTMFSIGKLWTCTSCDTAGLNGATGQHQVYLSSSAGTQDSVELPADLSFSRTKWRDTHSKNRFYINNGTNENLGNLK